MKFISHRQKSLPISLLYTAGAIVYAMKKPNPWPGHFGFHAIFHVCTVLAFLCHWTAVLLVAHGLSLLLMPGDFYRIDPRGRDPHGAVHRPRVQIRHPEPHRHLACRGRLARPRRPVDRNDDWSSHAGGSLVEPRVRRGEGRVERPLPTPGCIAEA